MSEVVKRINMLVRTGSPENPAHVRTYLSQDTVNDRLFLDAHKQPITCFVSCSLLAVPPSAEKDMFLSSLKSWSTRAPPRSPKHQGLLLLSLGESAKLVTLSKPQLYGLQFRLRQLSTPSKLPLQRHRLSGVSMAMFVPTSLPCLLSLPVVLHCLNKKRAVSVYYNRQTTEVTVTPTCVVKLDDVKQQQQDRLSTSTASPGASLSRAFVSPHNKQDRLPKSIKLQNRFTSDDQIETLEAELAAENLTLTAPSALSSLTGLLSHQHDP